MPKVLIIGATGYLGKRVADVLVQSGQHTVFGIARDAAKAKALTLGEIRPVVCADPVHDDTYLSAIRERHIDIIIDAASANTDSAAFLAHAKAIGAERRARGGPKLGFIYCSGTWVHGSSSALVNDLDVVGAVAPPRLVTWRVDGENAVLAASDVLDVAVVRPALIYGREGTIWTAFLRPLLDAGETVRVPLDPASRPGLIHVDDVATGFQAVVDKLPLINSGSVYPVFDLVTGQESMAEIFNAAAAACGLKGTVELVGAGDDAFAEAVSTTFRGSSARARQLLGWEPRRLGGFVADMDVYMAAFASQHVLSIEGE